MILEKWMICNLEKFGNCLISSKFYNKHKDKLVEAVQSLGYQDVHVLEKIRTLSKHNQKGRPKLIKTYIIETKIKRKEETHTEVKKMQKFHIGDKVEIIDGTQKGKIGTVEEVEKNDSGDYTYGIKVPSLYAKIGLMPKQASHLRLEKAAGKKRGRPAKAKETSKVEQLKEVTKEVVEMTEAKPKSTTAVDEPVEVVDEVVDEVVEVVDEVVEVVDKVVEVVDEVVEVVDEVVEVVDKVVEVVDKVVEVVDEVVEVVDEVVEVVDEVVEVVDEVVEVVDKVEEPVEPKAYDQLREVYDELCKKLNFVELSSFYDIVAKDVEASKYVLEQMYQMPIKQLAKIRKELA